MRKPCGGRRKYKNLHLGLGEFSKTGWTGLAFGVVKNQRPPA
jgi:hypothetical protein